MRIANKSANTSHNFAMPLTLFHLTLFLPLFVKSPDPKLLSPADTFPMHRISPAYAFLRSLATHLALHRATNPIAQPARQFW